MHSCVTTISLGLWLLFEYMGLVSPEFVESCPYHVHSLKSWVPSLFLSISQGLWLTISSFSFLENCTIVIIAWLSPLESSLKHLLGGIILTVTTSCSSEHTHTHTQFCCNIAQQRVASSWGSRSSTALHKITKYFDNGDIGWTLTLQSDALSRKCKI